MGFSVVVAHDLNNGIGNNNQLPWHCPVDMNHFKTLTTGKNQKNTVIMGRKTWESIPEKFRPLPNRTNIVLSNSQTEFDGAIAANSLNDALKKASSANHIFVIGGAQLYAEALTHSDCTALHVTKIFNRFDCDAHLPDYKNNFKCVSASNIWVNPNVNCAFFKYVPIAN